LENQKDRKWQIQVPSTRRVPVQSALHARSPEI